MRLLKKIFPLLSVLLLLGACENPIEPPIETGFTYKDEKNLGQQMHQAILNTGIFDILDATEYPEAIQYMSSIRVQIVGTQYMERLADYDWNVHIIHDDNIQDCFTTIGGQIYIFTGLLKTLQNEAQLFGILAHEVFYADKGYHMELIEKQYPFNILLDVSYGGEDQRALEMMYTFYDEPRNADKVLEADQYGWSLLCLAQSANIEMETAIENSYFANNLWYQNHPHPMTSSWDTRQDFFEQAKQDTTCGGTDDGLNRYLDFVLNHLPEN